MRTVQKCVDDLLSFFEHSDAQSFQVCVPVRSGSVVSVFERPRGHEIRTEVQSTVRFARSALVTKLYSDEAPKVTLVTRNAIPRVKTVASVSFERGHPLSLRASAAAPLFGATVKGSAALAREQSGDGMRVGAHTLAQAFGSLGSLRVETVHERELLLVDAVCRARGIVGVGGVYSWRLNRALEAQAVARCCVRGSTIGVAFGYLDKSLHAVVLRRIGCAECGAMVGVKNVGEEFPSDKVAAVAAEFAIDSSARAKCLLETDMAGSRRVSLDFRYRYMSFLSMKFSTTVNLANTRQRSFGLEILFDLNK